ncbi:hypothetical protein TWF730_000230 [Orbilia blumenaviensis]|uniref:F-box domain-containing protein n=1 Tax=Orbilia blumenaviensis TaxID=1796055 RepID=A0AAV9VN23_9PEZI
MASSVPTTIKSLPFEVLSEISSYLDNRSLKHLRLASPGTKVSAAAFPVLFRSFALRFRHPEYSPEKAAAIILACESLAAGDSHIKVDGFEITNPLKAIKVLVVDTSRPYITTRRDCWDYYTDSLRTQSRLASFEGDGKWLDGQLKRFKQLYAPEDYELFNRALQRVVETSKSLKHVKWHTSNTLGTSGHQEIALILCRPTSDEKYTLDVTLALDKTQRLDCVASFSRINTRDHFDCLFGLRSLTLKMPKHHEIARLDLGKSLDELAGRCQTLRIPSLERTYYVKTSKVPEYFPVFWKLSGPPLETLELVAPDPKEFTDDRWSKIRSGTAMTIVTDAWRYGSSSYPRLYLLLFLRQFEIWVKRLKLDIYPPDLEYYLSQAGNSFLTDIHINLRGQKMNQMTLGIGFWKDVVPMHAATFRSIRIFVDWQGGWCFRGESDNPAKLAIEQCKELEELRISFIDGQNNYITELVNCVLESCPKFHILEMEFCWGKDEHTKETNIQQTALLLEQWKSTEPQFKHRVLDVRRKIPFEDVPFEHLFAAKLSKYPELVWYDYLLQTWRFGVELGVGEGIAFKLNRVDDEYIYGDMLDDRSIEGPLKCMY